MTSPTKNTNSSNTRLSSSFANTQSSSSSHLRDDDDSSQKAAQTFSSKRSRRKQKQPRRLTLALSEDEYDMMLAEEEEGGNFKFHPGSKWQEPFVPGQGLLPKDPPQHGLTLYEVHRKPRMDNLSNSNTGETAAEDSPQGDKKAGQGRSRRKSVKGDPVAGASNRITCDYQNLVDEFRCVICFGTLRRAKIVRECLHRFCDSCVQTCLRRMSNSCPVCRTLIPSRRSLTVDHVYDTLIDALGLGDSDEDEDAEDMRVDQAMAIAASLNEAETTSGKTNNAPTNNNNTTTQMNSPSPLQVAIAKKQEMMRLQQQQQRASDLLGATMGNAATENAEAVSTTDQPGAQQNNEPIAPLVKLHLKPHPSETDEMPPLDLPYIRIAGNATIALLESFLKDKLGLTRRSTATGLSAPPTGDPVYLSTALWRKPCLRSMQLQQLAGGGSDDSIITLFYRRKKVIRKEE
ncbi:hypothetical protein ACA910_006346 [Epithemia clementina (nom. ined.)]